MIKSLLAAHSTTRLTLATPISSSRTPREAAAQFQAKTASLSSKTASATSTEASTSKPTLMLSATCQSARKPAIRIPLRTVANAAHSQASSLTHFTTTLTRLILTALLTCLKTARASTCSLSTRGSHLISLRTPTLRKISKFPLSRPWVPLPSFRPYTAI